MGQTHEATVSTVGKRPKRVSDMHVTKMSHTHVCTYVRTQWHQYATSTYDSQPKRVAEEIAEIMEKSERKQVARSRQPNKERGLQQHGEQRGQLTIGK